MEDMVITQAPRGGVTNLKRGEVTRVTDFDLVMRTADGTVTVSRSGFETLTVGESVLLDGSSLVGRVRPQPPGKIFQV